MPANAKNWVLLNNLSDKTLMRNMVAFEAIRRIGMDYTPAARLVDVMYNGELKGTYQLADKIEVGKDRIDIKSISPKDNEEPKVTGGYLIEIDASQSRENPDVIFTSTHGIPVTIQEPDEDGITPQQYDAEHLFSAAEPPEFSVEALFGNDIAVAPICAQPLTGSIHHKRLQFIPVFWLY